MKIISVKAICFTFLTIGLFSCKNENKTPTTEAKEVEAVVVEETWKAIPAQTMVTWEAKKIVGGHTGTINASNGVVNLKDGKLVGGNFILDLNTIACTDIPAEDENNAKLIGHLKNEDFFDVANHPNAAFEITSVKEEEGKSIIAGNLTLKGIKKNIEFPATINVTDSQVEISSDEFVIDRTDFEIKYNSGKFADPAQLGDYLIKDNVALKVNVIASK